MSYKLMSTIWRWPLKLNEYIKPSVLTGKNVYLFKNSSFICFILSFFSSLKLPAAQTLPFVVMKPDPRLKQNMDLISGKLGGRGIWTGWGMLWPLFIELKANWLKMFEPQPQSYWSSRRADWLVSIEKAIFWSMLVSLMPKESIRNCKRAPNPCLKWVFITLPLIFWKRANLDNFSSFPSSMSQSWIISGS